MIELIFAIGYTVSFIGSAFAFGWFLDGGPGRDWPVRPALAVAITLALLGPLVAVPLLGFGLRWLGLGLRDAYRLTRPAKPAELPRVKVRP